MNKYCFYCKKEVVPKVIEENEDFEVRGKIYNYTSIKSLCPYCKKELEVLDEDLDRRQDAFRKEEGLILNSEIEELLNKYKIGKKPLAKLLGWSEVTIIRYLNGETPSKMYSDKLYELLNSSESMKELLISNKNNITESAFKSSMKAISNKDNQSEINLVANYIIEKNDVTPLALQKLLYYCQCFYLAFYDVPMFKEDCEAWVHGPVYPSIYFKYKNYTYNTLYEKSEYSFDEIIDDEKKDIINSVLKYFGVYSAKVLEKMIHEELPWKEARKDVKNNENSNKIIKMQVLKDYFQDIIEKMDIVEINEIEKYSSYLYKKIINDIN